MTTLLGAVATRASLQPERVALVDVAAGTRWTYGVLVDRARACARTIGASAPPKAPVALVARPRPEVVAALYGVPEAGNPLVAANLRWTATDTVKWLRQARVGAAVLSHDARADLAPWPGPEVTGPQVRAIDIDDLCRDQPGDGEPSGAPSIVTGTNDAWWVFTSGTTGDPKLARLTHDSLLAASAATQAARPVQADDVYLYPFPLFHVSAFNVVHHHTMGATVVLCPEMDPATIARAVAEHGVTTISLAPTMIAKLLDHGVDLSSLRRIAYGAAAIHPELLRRAVDTWGCDFAQGYGMTELSGNAVFLDPDAHRRGLSEDPSVLLAAGVPAPGVTLSIRTTNGLEAPPGETGEICVDAPQVFAGYAHDPTATASALRDRWLHTGDLGRIRPDGLLEIVDRGKDVIVTGGENVASRRVEAAIAATTGVEAVAVVAAPDPYWGEAVSAVVVAADRATLARAEVHCAAVLAGFERPRRWFLVEQLPLNASGKVDKPALRRLLQEAWIVHEVVVARS